MARGLGEEMSDRSRECRAIEGKSAAVTIFSPRLWRSTGAWSLQSEVRETCESRTTDKTNNSRWDCTWTTNQSLAGVADMVWLYAGMYNRAEEHASLPSKAPGQQFAVFEGEPKHKHQFFWSWANIGRGLLLDFEVSWKLSAHVPTLYCSYADWKELYRLPPQGWSEDALVSAYISNAAASWERTRFLKELMDLVPVKSFGNVLNNAKSPPGSEGKVRSMRQYKFSLVLENEVDVDYVSEKIYEALKAGVLPIYKGAPNVEQFLPCSHCVLLVDKFDSVEHLAQELRRLDQDKTAFMEYFRWKEESFSIPRQNSSSCRGFAMDRSSAGPVKRSRIAERSTWLSTDPPVERASYEYCCSALSTNYVNIIHLQAFVETFRPTIGDAQSESPGKIIVVERDVVQFWSMKSERNLGCETIWSQKLSIGESVCSKCDGASLPLPRAVDLYS
eukprot:750942-Hanusia_phi.AAC.3